MSGRTRWLLLALALALLGAFGFVLRDRFERVSREVDLPPRGEARYNPLYGFGVALRRLGHDVQVRPTLQLDAMALAPGDLVLLGADVRSIGAADASALQEFVLDGGRLAFTLPDGDAEVAASVPDQFGLAVRTQRWCARWSVADAETPGLLCGQRQIVADESEFAEEDVLWQWAPDDDGLIALRAQLGDGEYLVLPHLRFLSHDALGDPSDAALAQRLFAPLLDEVGRVHLIYSVDVPPAHVLLLRHGWPVWIPLAALLLAWLWRRAQRLGPVLPLPPADRRALLEHVQAAGEFAFRRGRGESLHAALKRRFDSRLALEHPALAALEGDAQVLALALAWNLDPSQVRAALRPADLSHADGYAAAIRSLSRLKTPP